MPKIFAVFFLERKNYRKEYRQKMVGKIWLPQIFAIFFAERKNYRKYLRYFLQNAKNTAKNIAK